MGFYFPLATLLRLREIAERREERLLGQILNQMAQSRQTLTDLEFQRRCLSGQLESALQQSTSAFEITGYYQQMRQIDDLESAGRKHLAQLETLRRQQMNIYETAHCNSELLSCMKTGQLDGFQRQQTRQEQKMTDDYFSSRRRGL